MIGRLHHVIVDCPDPAALVTGVRRPGRAPVLPDSPAVLGAAGQPVSVCFGPTTQNSLPSGSASTVQAGYWRPRRHRGLRFSRNACVHSRASGSWLVAAITSIA